MPSGGKRILWNTLMIPAFLAASYASYKGLMGNAMDANSFKSTIGWIGLILIPILLLLGLYGFLTKNKKTAV